MGKLKKFALVGLACFSIAVLVKAGVVKYNSYLANEAGLAYNKAYPLDLNSYGIDYLSFTTIASSVTFANETFTDGQQSTGTITVASNGVLSGVAAIDYLVVQSTLIPSYGNLTVNGVTFNLNQYIAGTTGQIASNIAIGIASVTGINVSTGANSTLYSTATVVGIDGNAYTFSTNISTAYISFPTYTNVGATFASSQFSGGQSPATLSINGTNVSFTPASTSSGTAASIASSINSNTSLNTLLIATNNTTGTIVYTTSTPVGLNTNYQIISSTQSALTIGGPTTISNGVGTGQMWGGSNSAYTLVNGSATVINVANNSFTLGLPVLYVATSGQSITGLTSGVTYYVIPVTPNALGLASSSANAVAGTFLGLSSTQAKTTADIFTLSALAISGTPSYVWQVSNDATNWSNFVTTVGNVTISSVSLSVYNSTGTYNIWDFGPVDYRYIRLNVTSPTQGAIKLQVIGNGKNSSQ